MITVQGQDYNDYDKAMSFEFRGLSTDEKPTETYGGTKIANGSIFIEMDTEAILFYDADSKDWVGGGEEDEQND